MPKKKLFLAIPVLFLFLGAACNTIDTSDTSPINVTNETNQVAINTGNKVCDNLFYQQQLNAFSATTFDIAPHNPNKKSPYRMNYVCEYVGYIVEDDVNNFTTIGLVDDMKKTYFNDLFASEKLNSRWVADDKSTATEESFFSKTLPPSLSWNIATWSLYTHKGEITYVIEGVAQNNKHTEQETKDLMHAMMTKLMEPK
jgi:hypothetical protein